MMPYHLLGTDKPVATALEPYPTLSWLKTFVEVGAIAGLSSVVLVMMMGQTRIAYTISRDGLLPKFFGKVHARFRTPYVATIVVGVIAAALAGLVPLNVLGELVSMGTLLAFATVCVGVLVLRYTKPDLHRPFRVPMVWIICPLGAATCLFLFWQAFVVHWHLFVGWTLLGLLIYLGYGIATASSPSRPDPPSGRPRAGRPPARRPWRASTPPHMFKQLWATKHPHAAHEDANGLSLRRHLGPWADRARHRRGDRRRHFRHHRPGRRQPRRPGDHAVLRAGRHLLRLLRAGLCRIRLDGAGLRQRLHLRHLRRALGLVHRLDAGARVRRLRLGGGSQLDRLFPQPAQPVRHPSTGSPGRCPLDAQLRRPARSPTCPPPRSCCC